MTVPSLVLYPGPALIAMKTRVGGPVLTDMGSRTASKLVAQVAIHLFPAGRRGPPEIRRVGLSATRSWRKAHRHRGRQLSNNGGVAPDGIDASTLVHGKPTTARRLPATGIGAM